MTKIKFCGIRRTEDVGYVNELHPDYIGFVFWERSKRYVTPETAKVLKESLAPGIKAVGVFVDEDAEIVADLCDRGIIDIAQLHGGESEEYIAALRELTDAPIIKAFKVKSAEDIESAKISSADMVLLDSGYGTGKVPLFPRGRDLGGESRRSDRPLSSLCCRSQLGDRNRRRQGQNKNERYHGYLKIKEG